MKRNLITKNAGKALRLLCIAFLLTACSIKKTPSKTELRKNRITLPNGWSLTPYAEKTKDLGDLPLQMQVSNNQRHFAIVNCGVGKQYVQLFETKNLREISRAELKKSWYGLAFSQDDNQLFISGGNDNKIVSFRIENGNLVPGIDIKLGEPWPKDKICPTGIAVDKINQKLLCVTKEDNSLYVCDIRLMKVEKKIKLESEAYSVAISYRSKKIYVSLWGIGKIAVIDLSDYHREPDIEVGENPNEIVINEDQHRLFVANALDNSVSVVDMNSKKVTETLNTAMYENSPNGSTPSSLAINPIEHILYVANADNNNLAVFDIGDPTETRGRGFIPTGWYPTSVRTIANKIYVTNGKGFSSAANPRGPQPTLKKFDDRAMEYIGALFLGKLSVFNSPSPEELKMLTTLVFENTRYKKEIELLTEGQEGNPIPQRVGQKSPIKYVFYIIKENRTYDQVLGDLPKGNGDSSLCLFPRKVTPNQHSLAENFVLLDNFYVDAEVSADGHNWSMAAYANDFVEKTWPTSYGGRGGDYDFEGTRKVAFPRSGFIWDQCNKANLSYRTYGEFAEDYKANYKTLENHICPNYSSWDLNILDISREKVWEHDFDSLLLTNDVPRFNTIRFGNDHTSGMAKNAYSPFAAVADNDLALGRFVEHLSKSSIWKESAVFVLEDDAQNGADHVDAHRSIAFVISPFVKRKSVDHTHYTTSSMLRTIELILGLQPMSQYDAAATPMWRCFTSSTDNSPFFAIGNQVDIYEKNIVDSDLSRASEQFNLAKIDDVPPIEFNEILWKAIKGTSKKPPVPRRAAFVKSVNNNDPD